MRPPFQGTKPYGAHHLNVCCVLHVGTLSGEATLPFSMLSLSQQRIVNSFYPFLEEFSCPGKQISIHKSCSPLKQELSPDSIAHQDLCCLQIQLFLSLVLNPFTLRKAKIVYNFAFLSAIGLKS